MDWNKNLYIGENARKKASLYIQKLKEGKTPFDLYLLVYLPVPSPRMEILSAWNRKRWYAEDRELSVAGIALGKEEALEVFQQMVQDMLDQTGTVDFEAFFRRPGQSS